MTANIEALYLQGSTALSEFTNTDLMIIASGIIAISIIMFAGVVIISFLKSFNDDHLSDSIGSRYTESELEEYEDRRN